MLEIRRLGDFRTDVILVSLLCYLAVIPVESSDDSFSTEDVMMCLRMENEPTGVMVLGLTKNCYIFYGRMPNLRNNPYYRILDLKSDSEKACAYKRAYLMRAYGDDQSLIVLIDRFGRKIRVQPALSKLPKYTRAETGDFIWHYVNPRNRLAQFYTNNIDPGFTISGFYYFNQRLMIYAISHYNVRIYDLLLYCGNNYITPYLQLLAEPSLQLMLPLADVVAVRGEPLYDGSETLEIQQGEAVLSVPVRNLMFGSYYNVRPLNVSTPIGPFAYDRSKDYACGGIQSLLYFGFLAMTPEEWVLHISTRRWVNPLHAHRRMAYPHAIKRVKHHHFFKKGWMRAVPIMFTTIALVLGVTLVFLRLVGYYTREYRLRRSSWLTDRGKYAF